MTPHACSLSQAEEEHAITIPTSQLHRIQPFGKNLANEICVENWRNRVKYPYFVHAPRKLGSTAYSIIAHFIQNRNKIPHTQNNMR